MPRPRQMSDQAILDVARTVFLEHGPHASTQRIAERCGLSQAALFKRFGTKRDLLMRALRIPDDLPFFERIADGPRPGPLEPQLIEIGLALALLFRELVPCMATLSASGIEHAVLFEGCELPPPLRLQRAMTAWFDGAADRLDPDLDRRALATAFLGSLHVRAFFTYIGGSGLSDDPRPYVETVVRSLLKGAEVTP